MNTDKSGRVKKGIAGFTSEVFWLLHRTSGTATFKGKLSACYDSITKKYKYKGAVTATYLISDNLDFVSAPGRSDEYNFFANTVGAVYHRVLGARTTAPVEVKWEKTRSIDTTGMRK